MESSSYQSVSIAESNDLSFPIDHQENDAINYWLIVIFCIKKCLWQKIQNTYFSSIKPLFQLIVQQQSS